MQMAVMVVHVTEQEVIILVDNADEVTDWLGS